MNDRPSSPGKPRLLVVNQYYWPGVEATAHLLTELCEALTDEYDIRVLTGVLNGHEELPFVVPVLHDDSGRLALDAIVLDSRARGHHGSGTSGSFEWAVTACASVAAHLIDQGYAVHLVSDETAEDSRAARRASRQRARRQSPARMGPTAGHIRPEPRLATARLRATASRHRASTASPDRWSTLSSSYRQAGLCWPWPS